MKAVVLAAGKGERLWPLTETKAKPLLPIANKPMVQRTVEALVSAGIQDLLMVVGYRSESVREKLGDGTSHHCRIEYVVQKTQAGTADALAKVRTSLKGEERFIVVYGDDYYENRAVKQFVANSRENPGITLTTAKVDDASQFGTVDSRNGQVLRIREKIPQHKPGIVNVGLYVMNGSIFSPLEKTARSKRGEYELTESLNMLIEGGERVQSIMLGDEEWLGVSYPWDLLLANERAMAVQTTRMLKGTIEDGARIEGPVVVEENSIIKAGSRIEGPVHIGKNCQIGPSAYIRPYTSVGDGVKIGTACEVKNSIIMANSKIPHLSYIGDSILGEECSLGAGTITANLRFDEAEVKSRVRGTLVNSGRRKLGATIGDEVRTGINVSVFPGVKIGPKSWIGPGAIVDKDLASGTRFRA